jgi:hypothetical protein
VNANPEIEAILEVNAPDAIVVRESGLELVKFLRSEWNVWCHVRIFARLRFFGYLLDSVDCPLPGSLKFRIYLGVPFLLWVYDQRNFSCDCYRDVELSGIIGISHVSYATKRNPQHFCALII